MLTLTTRQQWLVGAALIVLMAVTRGHHFASVNHLPSASWAVFFLAGVYLRPLWSLPLLLLEAFLLDFAAVTYGGVSNFCVSPAYVFLVPAYGALWLGGRMYARLHQPRWHTFAYAFALLLLAAAVCQVISSGSFYYLSGRFVDPSLSGLWERLVMYSPRQLQNVLFYAGFAVVIHLTAVGFVRYNRKHGYE